MVVSNVGQTMMPTLKSGSSVSVPGATTTTPSSPGYADLWGGVIADPTFLMTDVGPAMTPPLKSG